MDLSLLTPWQWTLALLAALCTGMGKTGFSGIGMLTVVLMAEVIDARESTGVVLPILVFADIIAVTVFQRHAQWRYIGRLLPATFAGIVAGWFLMSRIPASIFRHLIGWIVLALLALQIVRMLRPGLLQNVPHTLSFGIATGGVTGITTMVANAAGPVMTIYLLAMELPKFQFVGTSAWFFFIVNLSKLPFSYSLGLIDTKSLMFNLLLAPGVILGAVLGRKLIGVVPQKLFERFLMIFTLIAALRLILA